MRNEGTTVRRMLLFVMASIAGIACPSPRRVAPPPPPPTPRVGLATPRAGVPPSPTARVAPASRLRVTGPREVSVFATIELAVSPPAGLLGERGRDGRTDGEIHDAYDANRDGRSLRLIARFSREGVVGKAAPGKAAPGNKVITVPGFAARDRPGGPWRFRVRWSPRRAGRWRARISLYLDGKEHIATLAHTIRARVDPTLAGPLIAPTRAAPRYLRCLAADGTSKARWLFGAARAWVVHHGRHAKLTGWARSSQLDRERDLLAPMRAAGENLLNQWMAPWEYLLVHHDRAEYWRQGDGTWRRYPLPTETAWTPYRAFDQGRAHAFDALVRSCEGGPKHPPVYLLLSPLPHQTLQMRHHPWGAQESGWSPTDDGGKQDPSKLNGFSGYRRGMSAWQFFLASPRAPKGDWQSKLFDHQANFFRYLIARYGAFRAIGAWVLVDELDAVGDALGNRAQGRGWWAHPATGRWLANIVRLFRGTLTRRDGLRYAGDPYHHPLHAATTASDGRLDNAGNMGWPGGPPGARPDLFGWHWYPNLVGPPRDATWRQSLDGLVAYGRSSGPAGGARLVSEFGLPDRASPRDAPSLYYPTLYHQAAWVSIFTGHAGTAIDWDDGKSFGDLRWRHAANKGAFSRARYPIDNTRTIVALRRFLRDLDPEMLVACRDDMFAVNAGGRVVARCARRLPRRAARGWIFMPRSAQAPTLTLRDLPAGIYDMTYYDPWTGDPVSGLSPQRLRVGKPRCAGRRAACSQVLRLSLAPVLSRLRRAAAKLPTRDRIARGKEVAFRLRPAP